MSALLKKMLLISFLVGQQDENITNVIISLMYTDKSVNNLCWNAPTLHLPLA